MVKHELKSFFKVSQLKFRLINKTIHFIHILDKVIDNQNKKRNK
jgi:hypothetical protein